MLKLLIAVRRQRHAQHLLYVCMLSALTADVKVSDPIQQEVGLQLMLTFSFVLDIKNTFNLR